MYAFYLYLAIQYNYNKKNNKTFHNIKLFLSFLEWKIPGQEFLSLLSFYCWSKTSIFAPYKSTLSLVCAYHLNMTNLSTIN